MPTRKKRAEDVLRLQRRRKLNTVRKERPTLANYLNGKKKKQRGEKAGAFNRISKGKRCRRRGAKKNQCSGIKLNQESNQIRKTHEEDHDNLKSGERKMTSVQYYSHLKQTEENRARRTAQKKEERGSKTKHMTKKTRARE